MEVTLSGRMGGPDAGARAHGTLVALRRELRAAFAPLGVPDLVAVDVVARFDGEVTTFTGSGGLTASRWRRSAGTLSLEVCFTAEEVARPAAELREVMRERLIACVRGVPAALDGEALAGAVAAAFERLAAEGA